MPDNKYPEPGSPSFSHDEDIHKSHRVCNEGSSNSEHAYAEHGPGIDHNIPQDDVIPAEPELAWSRIRRIMREPFSEFFGVFILVLFGDG
jgi:aquaglyceroporin related protein